jgi:DNA-3-methyladenine glycosylase
MTEPIADLLTPEAVAAAPVLPRGFYQRPTASVALDLLGKLVVRRSWDGVVALRIGEVEAYLGVGDPACHTFGGRRTARTETMWGEAGFAYVYLVYGLHSCLNVVTVGEGAPEAVLIRGGRPVLGSALIRRRRGPRVAPSALADGPGKLCQALALTTADDGADLCRPEGPVTIRDDAFRPDPASVRRLPRVGVDYAGEAAAWPLRLRLEIGLRTEIHSGQLGVVGLEWIAMKISSRGRYALRMMLDIARHGGQENPVSLSSVSKRIGISHGYLEQLALALRSARLLRGVAGRHGGYRLAEAPSGISVRRVLEATMGPICVVDCVDDPQSCSQIDGCEFYPVYAELNRSIVEVLDGFTLDDLLRHSPEGPRRRPAAPLTGACVTITSAF